jgi:hypothetical protein
MEAIYPGEAFLGALSLIRLTRVVGERSGDPSVSVGIIDGPVDLAHPAFAGTSLRTVRRDQVARCQAPGGQACAHGTGVAGILAAGRGSPAAAICPSCTFLLYPIFGEAEGSPAEATPAELASAIVETVDAGARIINLSLGVIPADTSADRELDAACEHAARRGVILAAAAGNQARLGFLPLLHHPWAIPVVSCDAAGLVTRESNLSPSIGKRGLAAPGVNIPTTLPGGAYGPISGTSAAAAIVTGSLALLWSGAPAAPASALRAAVLQAGQQRRRSLVPPLLDVEAVRRTWQTSISGKEYRMPEVTPQPRTSQATAVVAVSAAAPPRGTASRGADPRILPPRGVVVGQQADVLCPTCGRDAGQGENGAAEGQNAGPPQFIFAIGQVRLRYPSPSVEKEFMQRIAELDERPGGRTGLQADYDALKAYPYLINEVCWSFVIDGVETYLLVARDQRTQEQFVEAVKPADRGLDMDTIIGTRGPIASAEMCNGLAVPIVLVDRISSFQKPQMMDALASAVRAAAGKKPSPADEEGLRQSADELFERIQQLADNVGASDEHRAVNYLAVHSAQIYAQTAEMNARGSWLERVEVAPSRMATTRKLVNVIFTYINRKTDVEEKYRVRVDVTEKFPFIEKKLSQYFDRE